LIPFKHLAVRLKGIVSGFLTHLDSSPPIVIYQMGKVGSSTVYRSLANVKLSGPIYHVHFLSQEGIDNAERYFLSLQTPQVPEHIERSRQLRKRLDRGKDTQWKIITLVREPAARDISDLFQNVDSYWPELLDEEGKVRTNEALEFLQGRFLEYDETTNYTCTWFDRELKEVFNIDVYGTPFDHDRGYTIIPGQGAEVLILRLEDLGCSFGRAMSDFLGLDPGLEILSANVGEEKRHSAAYAYMLENITIPRAVCERIYASRYARHFYTESMRRDLVQRWSRE
jgi:hypothetical protein